MDEFELDRLKVRGGEIILVNGGTDISKNPVWIEGPHMLQNEEPLNSIPRLCSGAKNAKVILSRSNTAQIIHKDS